MSNSLGEPEDSLFERYGYLCSEMIAFSAKIRMFNLNKFKNNVTGSSLHSFVSHIGVSQIRVACCSRSNLQSKLLNTRNNFLRFTKMTLSSDNFSFSLASRTHLSIKIVISSSQFYPFGDSSLSSTFFTSYYIIRILCSSSFAVRTCYLLLN